MSALVRFFSAINWTHKNIAGRSVQPRYLIGKNTSDQNQKLSRLTNESAQLYPITLELKMHVCQSKKPTAKLARLIGAVTSVWTGLREPRRCIANSTRAMRRFTSGITK